jgi:mannose-6-phosphate isomerase-like protein (cupin superfamily)
MRCVYFLTLVTLLGCGRRTVVSGPTPAPVMPLSLHGRVIPYSAGTSLIFCRSPGLSVNIKVDSLAAGVTNFAMGTATIAAGASNSGTHEGQDEVVYFLRGDGRAFVGNDTTPIQPGLVTYVPRGTRHGFISTGSSPIEFVWVVVPGDLAARFRANGVPPGSSCPAGL